MYFLHHGQKLVGARLKLWHYYEHVRHSGLYDPAAVLAPDSAVLPESPWAAPHVRWLEIWNPHEADALFVNGKQWRFVPEDCTVPVTNLIQSHYHVDPEDERYSYLRRRAFRISINHEITDALAETGIVNGPVVTIPVGINIQPPSDLTPWTQDQRPVDVFIAGLKNPAIAAALSDALTAHGHVVVCSTDFLPRTEFLECFRRARVAITLPFRAEGFFFPPSEAMAQGCITVCPDAPGLGPYQHGLHVLRPSYDLDAILTATRQALAFDNTTAERMRSNAVAFVQRHTLENEQRGFLDALDAFEGAW